MSPDSEHVHGWRIPALPALLGVLGGLLLWQRFGLAWGGGFDPEELRHMHAGFSKASGLTPFVDNFEHHTPWFSWLCARLIEWRGPNWDTLMFARGLCGALSVAALWVTWSLERTISGRSAALVALVIHGTFLASIEKGIEIRPDVPAALLFSLSLLWGARTLRKDGSHLSAVASGLALGSALMFTPKLAFGAVGFGSGALLFVLVHGSSVRGRLPRLLVLFASVCLPAAVKALVLYQSGHFGALFESAVMGPLRWEREVSPGLHLGEAIARNPLSVTLGALGLVAMFCRGMSFRKESPEDAEPMLFVAPLAALAILIGWFLVPVPWPQYLMPIWALLGIGAAQLIGRLRSGVEATVFFSTAAVVLVVAYFGLDMSLDSLGTAFLPPAIIGTAALITLRTLPGKDAMTVLGIAVSIGLLSFGLYRFQPHGLHWALPWFSLALLIVTSPPRHLLRVCTLMVLLGGPLIPIARLESSRPMSPIRAEYDLVMAKTAPEDTVLTGRRGCAVFRPHAYKYFFLSEGVLQRLSEEQLGPLPLAAIRSKAPAAAIRDAGTRGLSEEVQAYLDKHYAPSGVGDIWLRKAAPR